MAYVLNNGFNQEYDEQNGQGVGQPVQLAGQNSVMPGTGTASSNPSAASTVPKRAATSGTGFTNISQYLDQNTNQAQQLASSVGDYVKTQGNEARSALDQAETGFNNKVEQNIVRYDQDKVKQASQKTAQFTQDQANVDAFKKMRDASYNGPNSFEDDTENYQLATGAVSKANNAGTNVQTEQGKKEILSEIQKGRNASAGVNTFNNLLLSGDNARQILQQSAESLNDLDPRLKSITEAGKQKAQFAKQETDATRNAIISQFGGEGVDSVSTYMKQLQDNAQKFIKNTDSLTQSAVQKFQANKALNDNELRVLGMTRDQYNNLLAQNNYLKSMYGQSQYGNLANPSYLAYKNAGAEYSIDNVTSADQYARLQALSQLMDGDIEGFISNPDKLGTAKDDLVNFNYNTLSKNIQSTLDAQTKARQSQRQAAINELNAAQSNYDAWRKEFAWSRGSMGAGMALQKAEDRLNAARSTFNKYGSENQSSIDFRAIQALLDKYNKGSY